MGSVVHISEQEAARDFAAVIRRVRAGDEVVVDCADGVAAVMLAVVEAKLSSSIGCVEVSPVKMRSISEIMLALKDRKAEQGLAVVDAEFVRDVEEARERYNAPLDTAAWD